jgi:hypothetical protein
VKVLPSESGVCAEAAEVRRRRVRRSVFMILSSWFLVLGWGVVD